LKIEQTPRDDHQVQIVAEFGSEELEPFKGKAIHRIAQEAKIPGFRPGKAPASIIRRMYGDDTIEKEAVELMIDDVYPKIIDEANIKPSGPGSLQEIVSSNPPKFSFLIPLEPDVQLGDYRSIRQEYKLEAVPEKKIEETLRQYQMLFSTTEPVERPAANGDVIYIKLSGHLVDPAEGEDPELIKETPYQYYLGDSSLNEGDFPYKGFEDALVGLSANDEKTITYTYPDDFDSETLKGKKIEFHVKVESIKVLKLPELNDEFAHNVGQFENLDALKQSIRVRLEAAAKHDYEDEYFSKIIEKLVGMATIKYPPQMLEEEQESVLHSIEQDLAEQKLDLEAYMKLRKTDREKFIQDEVTPAAKKRLEQSLTLEAIAREENIKLEEEEINQAFNDALADMQYSTDFRKLQRKTSPQRLANAIAVQAASRLMNQHVLERLKDIATGKAGEKPAEEKQPQEEAAKKPAKKAAKPAAKKEKAAATATAAKKKASTKTVKKPAAAKKE
jgi:trigger factor